MSIFRTLTRFRRGTTAPKDGSLSGIDTPSARVPEEWRVYAVGDIHGRVDLLRHLLDEIERDAQTTPKAMKIVFVGDYIDRGNKSREVVDLILQSVDRLSGSVVTLMGNHEEALLDFLDDPAAGAAWLQYGGDATVLSYRVGMEAGSVTAKSLESLAERLADAIPAEHHRFYQALQNSHSIGDYYFVHAGIRPRRKLEAQDSTDLHWIREEFLDFEGLHPKVVIHGHTVSTEPELMPNRIGIDTGAYFSGRLTCVVLDGTDIRFIQT